MLKGKDLTVFVRYGGLDLKTQKGYKREAKTYHSPPAPRGFYAMPKIAQELFLIGSLGKTQPSSIPKEPRKKICGEDENGIPICSPPTEEEWTEYFKRHTRAIDLMRKEFKKTRGELWHHLGEYTDRSEVVATHGDWVKTSISAWKKAFSKMTLKFRYGENRESGWNLSTKSINEPARSGLFGVYSLDHCEVFFDEKV